MTRVRTLSDPQNRNEMNDENNTFDATGSRPTRSLVAGMIAGTTVFGTIALISPFVLGYVRSPLPYMATPSNKVQNALRFVRERKRFLHEAKSVHSHDNKGSPSFVLLDLGSGDGETVYQAVKSGYSKAVGIELNFTLYCISQFRRYFLWSVDERKRSVFYCKDFFRLPPNYIAQADTIMIFGVPSIMLKISQTLAKHCAPETHILAYRFPIPVLVQMQATEQTKSINETSTIANNHLNPSIDKNNKPLLEASLLYNEEEMRIYECGTVYNEERNK